MNFSRHTFLLRRAQLTLSGENAQLDKKHRERIAMALRRAQAPRGR